MIDKLIIGVSGKKQSGKNTLCDCLYKFFSEKYSSNAVSIFSFADTLKQKVCKDILGLTEEQVNGTDDQKNSSTKYKWENLPHQIRYDNKLGCEYAPNGEIYNYILPKGLLTAREIMQIIGTDIFRNYFDDNVWVNATLRAIEKSDAKVILISDVRFPSEVFSIINKENGYVIRLLRDVCETDSHSSEIALDKFCFSEHKCIVLDNKEMSVDQQNKETKIIASTLFVTVETSFLED